MKISKLKRLRHEINTIIVSNMDSMNRHPKRTQEVADAIIQTVAAYFKDN